MLAVCIWRLYESFRICKFPSAQDATSMIVLRKKWIDPHGDRSRIGSVRRWGDWTMIPSPRYKCPSVWITGELGKSPWCQTKYVVHVHVQFWYWFIKTYLLLKVNLKENIFRVYRNGTVGVPSSTPNFLDSEIPAGMVWFYKIRILFSKWYMI